MQNVLNWLWPRRKDYLDKQKIKKLFIVQLIFTSGVPGVSFLWTVLSSFTLSENTDGRGEYSAVILATFVGVGTTWVEVKLSFSNI